MLRVREQLRVDNSSAEPFKREIQLGAIGSIGLRPFLHVPYMKKPFTAHDYCGYTTFRQRQILPLQYKGKECRKSIIPTANICNSSCYCLIFRVKGISGLRIVDGSVMRSETSGNINAPIIMIAEKASDLIRGKNTVERFMRQIKPLNL